MDFNSPEYKKYRKAYITQCTVEHLVGLLIADAFLARLLSYLGLSDGMVGIIASFTSVAFAFQLLSVFLVQSKYSTKKMVVVIDMVSTVLFAFIYFLPFLPVPGSLKKIIVVASVITAQAAKSIISSLYFKWANAYVEAGVRATFSAKKECISLITGIVFVLGMGYVVDRFEDVGSIEGGLLFIAMVLLVLNIVNFISFILIKDEDANERKSMNVSMREVFGHIASNKIFKRFTVIDIIVTIGTGMLYGFLGTYKIKELAFSVFAVQIINILADFMRMAFSMPFAKYSDKHGFARGLFVAGIMSMLANSLIVFTTPQTRYLIVLYSCIYTVAQAGTYQNSFNIGYTILPQKYMVQAMAIKRTATGLVVFLASIAGGVLLESVQNAGNSVLGVPMYGQQLLAIIAISTQIPGLILNYKFVIKPIDEMRKKGEKSYD